MARFIDHRVRIRPVPGQENKIYGTETNPGYNIGYFHENVLISSSTLNTDGNPNNNGSLPAAIMAPLRQTMGLIFPYTPVIRWGNDNDYQQMGFVHTNSDYSYFIRQNQMMINITGEFTAQNDKEAKYMLAAIHFLSANSKMRFGASDPNRGLPPPVLLLSGYGNAIFPDMPVLIKSWSIDYSNTVDLVEVTYPLKDLIGYVPSKATIAVDLIVQNRPIDYLKKFNLDKFRNGDLLTTRSGFR